MTIFLKGDSQIVVKAILQPHRTGALMAYGHIIEDIKTVLPCFRSWDVGHIHREGNTVVHCLAKRAVGEETEQIWLEETPCCIQDIVLLERLALAV
jgi:hypothetical protein